MIRVPDGSFGARILRREYQLVASFTAGNVHLLGVVASAEDVVVREEVHQLGQNFMTNRTGETVRMPALVASGSLRENGHLSSADGLRTILTQPNFLDLHRHFWNLGRDNRWRYFNPVAARTAVAAVAVRMRHGQSIVVHWRCVVIKRLMGSD